MHLSFFEAALAASAVSTALAAAQNGTSSASSSHQRFWQDRTILPKVEVKLSGDKGTIVGTNLMGIETFEGIPYAEPPIGNLRFRPPVRRTKPYGRFDATQVAYACPQQFLNARSKNILESALGSFLDLGLPIFKQFAEGREDCLTVTVQRPIGTRPDAKLPVMAFIYGGGFAFGATNEYYINDFMSHAVNQDQPFVYVAINYRLHVSGTLTGKEAKAEGSTNGSLRDQRMALEWIADHIRDFGGDPDQVVLYGESAGGISIMNQIFMYNGDATYKGKAVFHGAIMSSGNHIAGLPVDSPHAQSIFDKVVDAAGCKGSNDPIYCLRALDVVTFKEAAATLPGFLAPKDANILFHRPDGETLNNTINQILEGKYHRVPMILGAQEDEGSLFSFLINDVQTLDQRVEYLQNSWLPSASNNTVKTLAGIYEQDDYHYGCPFRTSPTNSLYSGFKKNAAIL